METIDKIVEFDKYCDSCVYAENKEKEEPCNECLSNTTNLYSHKPVKYKAKK